MSAYSLTEDTPSQSCPVADAAPPIMPTHRPSTKRDRVERTASRIAAGRGDPMPDSRTVLIRDATADDWPQIWAFLRQVVTAGETYAYDPDMDEATARQLWLVGPPARAGGATDHPRTVRGTADMVANRPRPGA